MSQKLILTEQQHNLIIQQVINEMVEVSLNEDAWEKIKYGLSKLGRYKAGGKILGKSKVDAESQARIQAILDQKGNEVIKNLDDQIKSTNPEFPNNEKGVEFLNSIMAISAVYDSVVAATQKPETEEGYLPPDAANAIINDLREYVKKYLDVDLKAAYSVVDEAMGNILQISDQELRTLDELYTSDPENRSRTQFDKGSTHVTMPKDEPAAATAPEPEAAPADPLTHQGVRQNLQNKRGDGEEFDSERMKTLKSNRLPLLMSSIGTALGGLSWLTNTDWFKSLFQTISTSTNPTTIQGAVANSTKIFNDIKPNEGVYKFLGRVTNHHLNANSKPQELIDALKQISGNNDPHKGIDLLCQKGGIMMKPDAAKAGLDAFINNPSKAQNLNDLFRHDMATGTGKVGPVDTTLYGTRAGGSMTTFITNAIAKSAVKFITTTTVKTAAGYGVAKGLGAVLGPVGIGAIAAGAVVKLMRMKGQKQSRAKTLNDLYQSIRNVSGGAGIIEPQGEVGQTAAPQGPKSEPDVPQGQQGNVPRGTNDDLYNSIRNLFQNIVNQRVKLGFRAAPNTGTGSVKLKAGDKKRYNDKTVEVVNPDLNGRVQVRDVNRPTTVFTVKPEDLLSSTAKAPAKAPLSDMGRFEEDVLMEGRYIKDKRTEEYLQKSLSPDKLRAFEEFLNRIEAIRNKLKKAKGRDKVLDGMLDQLNSNPIMATNFEQMFNIPSNKANEVASLKSFINDLFISVYSSKYKYSSMIDKIAGLGGNINKLEEAYDINEPNTPFTKDAQDRGRFKGNLLKFLTSLIGIFQYLGKIKNSQPAAPQNPAQGPVGAAAPQSGAEYDGKPVTKVEPPNVDLEPGNVEIQFPNGNQIQVNKDEVQGLMQEEIKRIKKLMQIV